MRVGIEPLIVGLALSCVLNALLLLREADDRATGSREAAEFDAREDSRPTLLSPPKGANSRKLVAPSTSCPDELNDLEARVTELRRRVEKRQKANERFAAAAASGTPRNRGLEPMPIG